MNDQKQQTSNKYTKSYKVSAQTQVDKNNMNVTVKYCGSHFRISDSVSIYHLNVQLAQKIIRNKLIPLGPLGTPTGASVLVTEHLSVRSEAKLLYNTS